MRGLPRGKFFATVWAVVLLTACLLLLLLAGGQKQVGLPPTLTVVRFLSSSSSSASSSTSTSSSSSPLSSFSFPSFLPSSPLPFSVLFCSASGRHARDIRMSRGTGGGGGGGGTSPSSKTGGGGGERGEGGGRGGEGGGGEGGGGRMGGAFSPWASPFSMFGPSMFTPFHTLDNLYAEMMDNVERVQAEMNRLYYPPFGARHHFHPALGAAAAGPAALRAPALPAVAPGDFPLAVTAGGGGGPAGSTRGGGALAAAGGGLGGGGLMPYYNRGGLAGDLLAPAPYYWPSASSMLMPFSRGGMVTAVAPRVDFVDKGDEYLMKADVPGVDKSNIKIQVHNGMLHITGEQQQESVEERKGVYMQERHQAAFSRSVPLPENVREDDIRASMKDGVLAIHIPKQHIEKTNIKNIHVE